MTFVNENLLNFTFNLSKNKCIIWWWCSYINFVILSLSCMFCSSFKAFLKGLFKGRKMIYNLDTKRRGRLPNWTVQLGGQSAGLNIINRYIWVSTHKSLKTCCFAVYQQRKKNLLLCKLCVCLQSPVKVIHKNLQLL